MKSMRAALLVFTLVLSAFPLVAQDFNKGVDAYDAGDYTTALQEWKPLAEQGHATSQYNLGVIYDKGKGVSQNHSEAYKWYRKAAEQGDANAQLNLGSMYRKGEGVLQDYSKAFKWNNKAAEQGHSGAQINLGVMYIKGEGVLQDNVKAHMWANIAAVNGNSGELRDLIAEKMTPADISKAQTLARECMKSNYKDCGW